MFGKVKVCTVYQSCSFSPYKTANVRGHTRVSPSVLLLRPDLLVRIFPVIWKTSNRTMAQRFTRLVAPIRQLGMQGSSANSTSIFRTRPITGWHLGGFLPIIVHIWRTKILYSCHAFKEEPLFEIVFAIVRTPAIKLFVSRSGSNLDVHVDLKVELHQRYFILVMHLRRASICDGICDSSYGSIFSGVC